MDEKSLLSDYQVGGVVSGASDGAEPPVRRGALLPDAGQHPGSGEPQGGRVPQVRPLLQAQELPPQPPEMGVRQGPPVPVPLLQLPRQAEDARRPPHRAHAPGKARDGRDQLAVPPPTPLCSSSRLSPHPQNKLNRLPEKSCLGSLVFGQHVRHCLASDGALEYARRKHSNRYLHLTTSDASS